MEDCIEFEWKILVQASETKSREYLKNFYRKDSWTCCKSTWFLRKIILFCRKSAVSLVISAASLVNSESLQCQNWSILEQLSKPCRISPKFHQLFSPLLNQISTTQTNNSPPHPLNTISTDDSANFLPQHKTKLLLSQTESALFYIMDLFVNQYAFSVLH
jgi:hypothetical protein